MYALLATAFPGLNERGRLRMVSYGSLQGKVTEAGSWHCPRTSGPCLTSRHLFSISHINISAHQQPQLVSSLTISTTNNDPQATIDSEPPLPFTRIASLCFSFMLYKSVHGAVLPPLPQNTGPKGEDKYIKTYYVPIRHDSAIHGSSHGSFFQMYLELEFEPQHEPQLIWGMCQVCQPRCHK